jgi:hypothetical protein
MKFDQSVKVCGFRITKSVVEAPTLTYHRRSLHRLGLDRRRELSAAPVHGDNCLPMIIWLD